MIHNFLHKTLKNISSFPSFCLPLSVLLTIVVTGCQQDQNSIFTNNNTLSLPYPSTIRENIIEEYFGTPINDPYRWLEGTNNAPINKWLNQQEDYTKTYLNQVPYRSDIASTISKLSNHTQYELPIFLNDKTYYLKTTSGITPPIFYKEDTLIGDDTLLSLNLLKQNEEVTLGQYALSDNGRYLAFELHLNGKNRSKILVKDLKNGKILSDTLHNIVDSKIIWYKNGFYYTGYPPNKYKFHSVFYHRIGNPQANDKIIFTNRSEPYHQYHINATSNKQFLIISANRFRTGNALYFKKMNDNNDSFIPIIQSTNHDFKIIDYINNKFLVHTNYKAPRYRLVLVDPKDVSENKWEEVIPEEENTLETAYISNDKIICQYIGTDKVSNRLNIRSLEADYLGDIEIPMSFYKINGITIKKNSPLIYINAESFFHPPTIFEYNFKNQSIQPFKDAPLSFNPKDYVTRQFFYPSEGNEYPILVTYRKGLNANGTNPTLLTGYGGFNKNMLPTFDVGNIAFMDKGGLIAQAILKGGGERGTDWYKAGTHFSKTTTFDDFVKAADFLIEENYTSSEKLAISGKENGGLLVTTCLTKHPGLFKVVIAENSITDMLRYDQFTQGYQWTNEYGSSSDSLEFFYLQDYSPLHNIKAGLHYPATLIMTGRNDEVVVPAHSYKFTATLQEKNRGKNPILLSTIAKGGHNQPSGSHYVEALSNKLAFLFYHLNMTYEDESMTQ